MKITRKNLENLIKEEINKLMSEESDLIDLLKEYKKARLRVKTALDEEGKQEARERSEQLRLEINSEINSLVPRVDLGHESVLALSLKQNRTSVEDMISLAQELKELLETRSKPKDIEDYIENSFEMEP
tara:strand:- start:1981 stop:2367 length:387 start_codon:yes stop_codon:yes gene_type:complete